MRRWRWVGIAALGVALYTLFLLVFAPADYITRHVAPLTHHAVALQQARGTLWGGNATLIVPRLGPQPLGQLEWKLHPWRLFVGTLAADLALTGRDVDARGAFHTKLHRHALRGVVLTAPVKALSLVYPASEALGLGGRFHVTATALEFDKDAMRGDAVVVWSDATSRLLPLTQTGEYRLQIVAQGKRATLNLSTVQGPLRVTGEGEWRLLEDGLFRLQGSVTPATPQPAIEPFLSAIGPAQPNGAHPFTIETRLGPINTFRLFR